MLTAGISVGIAVKIQRIPAQSRGGGGGRMATFPNPRRGPVLSFTVSIHQSIGSVFLVGVVAAHARAGELPESRLGLAEVFLLGCGLERLGI